MIKDQLIDVANEALKHAYAPYSNFPVGAALLTESGKIFTGCNVENASFGLTNCAERTAIFKAVSEGERQFKCLVITGQTNEAISPCGACRQVIAEFCEADMPVILTNATKSEVVETNIGTLLPGAFNQKNLK